MNKGKIPEVSDSVKILKDREGDIILCVTGLISIATFIFESRLIYRVVRKEKDKIDRLLAIIESSTVKYMPEAIKQRVNIISFADLADTVDIFGLRVYFEIAEKLYITY